MRWTFGMSFMILSGLVAVSAAVEKELRYPQTSRIEHFDVYHGVRVADPYRWLEDDVRTSKAVADWVAAENTITRSYLAAIPQRDRIKKRLTELWNFAQYSSPFKEGGKYFYFKNDGLQNQAVLYTQDSLEGTPRVLLDPNQWSKDGAVALSGLAVSDDGMLLAYGRAEAGSDWSTWHVVEVDTGRVLSDELKWTKFTSAAWTKDSRGFFYTRFEEPKKGQEFQSLNFNNKLFYHRIGTPQSKDVLVYARPDHPDWMFAVAVTEDGRYLVITIERGTDPKYRIVVKDLAEPYSMPVDVVHNFDNEYTLAGNDGSRLFFLTDLAAPRRRLVSIDLDRPVRERLREIIPQAEETLLSVAFIGNLFVASYLKDVKPEVKVFSMNGRFVRDVQFPGIGSAGGFAGKRVDTETFYVFSSFATLLASIATT